MLNHIIIDAWSRIGSSRGIVPKNADGRCHCSYVWHTWWCAMCGCHVPLILKDAFMCHVNCNIFLNVHFYSLYALALRACGPEQCRSLCTLNACLPLYN